MNIPERIDCPECGHNVLDHASGLFGDCQYPFCECRRTGIVASFLAGVASVGKTQTIELREVAIARIDQDIKDMIVRHNAINSYATAEWIYDHYVSHKKP